MVEAIEFNPGSVFGIPVVSFPPGMRWSTRREMLREVMADLHRDWVQDYLLRHEASDDVRVLSSPAKLSKSKSFTFAGFLDYNRPQTIASFNLSSTMMFVPALNTDDISAGVCIEQSSGYVPPPDVLSCTSKFRHFVRNDRTGALCVLYPDEQFGAVEMFYYKSESTSNYVYLTVRFKTSCFEKAFKTDDINFDLLEQSMITMNVGYSNLGRAVCTCHQRDCVECRITIDSLASGFALPSINLSYFEYGDFYTKSVLSNYDEGVLMQAVPLFAYVSMNVGALDFCIDELVRWGMVDRLGRLKPAVPTVIPATCESLEENGTLINASTCTTVNVIVSSDETCEAALQPKWDDIPEQIEDLGRCGVWSLDSEVVSAMPENLLGESLTVNVLSRRGLPIYKDRATGTVPIAPAPLKPSSSPSACVAVLNAIETERFAKLERRKIRKREAAFRSSAKRSERRRIARLAREKEASQAGG